MHNMIQNKLRNVIQNTYTVHCTKDTGRKNIRGFISIQCFHEHLQAFPQSRNTNPGSVTGSLPGYRTPTRIQDPYPDTGPLPGYRIPTRIQDPYPDTGSLPGYRTPTRIQDPYPD